MQDADHVDLATWLRENGAMPADAAVSMVGQIAEALDALHDAGEAHGAVTASAVVLAGVAGPRVDPSTLRASLAREGAPPPGFDRRTDIADLGRVLVEALTAPSPDGSGPALPAGLDEVTTRASSGDPARGYERAVDLAAAARAALRRPSAAPGTAGGASDTLVRPIDSGATADPSPADAPAAGTLVRPLAATTDPAATLDRLLAPTTDPGTTLDRPLAPATDTHGMPHRPVDHAGAAGTAGGTPGQDAAAPAPGWAGTRRSAPTAQRNRRPLVIAAVVVVGVLVAGLAVWALFPESRLEVRGAAVAPATGRDQTCDAAVDLVGTIRTNGQAGTVTYTWSRSDGSVTSPRTETIGEGSAGVEVHLLWKVTGKGRFPATATLRILEPTPTDASAEFVYDCR